MGLGRAWRRVLTGLVMGSLVATMLPSRSLGDPGGGPGVQGAAESSEVTGLRTASSRTFKEADGTFTTESYSSPIHFREGRGGWAPIRTELVEDRSAVSREARGSCAMAALGPFGKVGKLAKAGEEIFQHGDEVVSVARRVEDAAGATPNRIYSNRVLRRSEVEIGPYHNFPTSFDDVIFEQGDRQVVAGYFEKSKPHLTNDSVLYRLPGSLNGTEGVFEIFTRPSTPGRTELIMHRFFRALP